eukprot:6070069-Amphidinium_carterae.1
MVAYCGGAKSGTSSQSALDPECVKHRKRPLPIGPAFHNVMIFPAPDLWRFIDTTTYYIVHLADDLTLSSGSRMPLVIRLTSWILPATCIPSTWPVFAFMSSTTRH